MGEDEKFLRTGLTVPQKPLGFSCVKKNQLRIINLRYSTKLPFSVYILHTSKYLVNEVISMGHINCRVISNYIVISLLTRFPEYHIAPDQSVIREDTRLLIPNAPPPNTAILCLSRKLKVLK